MKQGAEDEGGGGSRPEQVIREELRSSTYPRHHRVLHPLARHEWRGGPSENRDEVDERSESFGPGETFGPYEPEEQHEAAAGEHRDDRQNVLGAPSGKDVD